jgi:hypothetical protein
LKIKKHGQAGTDGIPVGIGMCGQNNLTGDQKFLPYQLVIRIFQHRGF